MVLIAKPRCWCGGGCDESVSSTDPRIRSERDAVAKYLTLHGPMPVYAEGKFDAGPVYWIESLDDPRIGKPVGKAKRKGENVPVDPVRKAREAEALRYVADYRGTWGLPLDIRADRRWGTKYMSLSDRQIEVLLAGKARDAARVKERPQTGRDLRVLPIGTTRAAVDNDEGTVTFLRIDRPGELDHYKQPSKWWGWVFVKQQRGPIDDYRIGSQRPGESYVGQWPNLIDKVLADPMGAVQRYGRELGECGVCGLELTNAESRELGIGPVCYAKMQKAQEEFDA